MNEEPVYYTPKIEEFRVGFRYEWKAHNEEWQKATVPNSLEIFKGKVRVKYLDKEDIKELGFEDISTENPSTRFISKDNKGNVKARLIIKGTHVVILNAESYTKSSGTIKNKLELEYELKRIGLF